MSTRFLKVEGNEDLVRDTSSNAIINRNKTAYEVAKKRAEESQRQRDEIRTALREINSLKSDMHEIKTMIVQLVGKV
tara:strand:- start:17393 stop:17623 length:231 start_codon:yes stop_codon:yes gene_type:complete